MHRNVCRCLKSSTTPDRAIRSENVKIVSPAGNGPVSFVCDIIILESYKCVVRDLNLMITSLFMWYRAGNISSGLSRYFEAKASEYLDNPE